LWRSLFITVISSGGLLHVTTGITIDENDKIFVTDSNKIISIDPSTGVQTEISSGGFFTDIIDLTIDANGDILVADFAQIIRVDPLTGEQTRISIGGTFLNGVAVAANGDIIVADFEDFGGTGSIIKVDPLNGDQTEISTDGFFVDPAGIFIVPQAENEKILICHKEKITVSVSENAVPAHLAHGDKLGTCEE